jgi:hypothetical protein
MRLAEILKRLVESLQRVKQRPMVVEEALEHDYGDVDEWRERGGGIAPDDAQHIDPDGI